MSVIEFNCVVLGQEPAGLCLLRRFGFAFAQSSIKPQFGWINLSQSPPRICVPSCLPEYYQISVREKPWHLEIITPQKNLLWSQKSLAEEFPELPPHLLSPEIYYWYLAPQSHHLKAIRKALHRRPELLSYCTAVLKYCSRTRHLLPEHVVWNALLCTELSWWKPAENLPGNVTNFTLSDQDNPIEEIKKLRHGALSIRFKNCNPVVGQRWVINLPHHSLKRLCLKNTDLLKYMSLESEFCSNHCLYRLRIQIDDIFPFEPVPPVTLLIDSLTVPEWDSEIWPFELNTIPGGKELVLYASAPRWTSLDKVLLRFREGMKRLNRLFPFLPGYIKFISIPLSMENCFNEDQRHSAGGMLEKDCIEFYDRTWLNTQTRLSGLTALLPSLQCHLPYPIGPVNASRNILEYWVGKKKWKTMSSAQPTSKTESIDTLTKNS